MFVLDEFDLVLHVEKMINFPSDCHHFGGSVEYLLCSYCMILQSHACTIDISCLPSFS